MKKTFSTVVLLAMLCAGFPASAVQSFPAGQMQAPTSGERLLVKLRAGPPDVSFLRQHRLVRSAPLLGRFHFTGRQDTAVRRAGLDRLFVMTMQSPSERDGILQNLRQDRRVEYAEPDREVSLAALPNDPSFPLLWGMHNTGQSAGRADADIDAPESWDSMTGFGGDMVIGLIDTGIDYTHPDLAANMWTNPGEIAANNIDDDGNGFVDDVHGYDFVDHDSDPMDENSHGTHCAGTIAGAGNNGIGVAGVNWTGKIAALKVFRATGGASISDIISALAYANMMGFRITSNSWGWTGGPSQALSDAITASDTAGYLFVAAAGNAAASNEGATIAFYPSSYTHDNVVAVASSDRNDLLSSFSNYGATSVDLAAPGSSIYSTVPVSMGSYGYKSGTSMATPHVAGALALLWTSHPEMAYDDVKTLLLNRTEPLSTLQGKAVSEGRLSIGNFFQTDTVPPAAAANLQVTQTGLSTATLTWTAPGDDGTNGRVSRYDVRFSTSPLDETTWASAGRSTGVPLPANAGTNETFTVTGLQEGTTYFIGVKATDDLRNDSTISSITTTTSTCPHANPLVSMSPSAQTGAPAQALSYTIAITNTDSLACEASVFSVHPVLPAGWSQPALSSVTIAPGATVTRSVSVLSAPGAAEQDYVFAETVTNDSHAPFAGSGSAVYTVELDHTSPAAAITSPLEDTLHGGWIFVEATASDAVGVVSVEFYADNELVPFDTDTLSPYGGWWYTGDVSDGPHLLMVKAYDAAGNSAVSVPVSVITDNTLPTVAFTTPQTGEIVSGTVTVAADAADENGVTLVEFYKDDDWSPFATDTTSPYGMSWNTRALPNGEHTLWAVAYDAAGNGEAASIDVTIENTADSTPPTVSITAPANGITAGGTIAIDAAASDTIGVTMVEFYKDNDTTAFATDTTAPYGAALNTIALSDGSHVLKARAYDEAGNIGTSDTVSVTVDNTSPALSALTASGITGVSATITWTTNEPADSQVEYGLTASYGSATALQAPMAVSHGHSLSGLQSSVLYHYRVKSKDAAGNLATSGDFTFTTADITAPTASLTAPVNGTIVRGSVAAGANASDAIGVTTVEFYKDNDTTAFATDTTAPYGATLNTAVLADGAHTLKVKAYDAAGNIGTSGTVSVTVDNTLPIAAMTSPANGAQVKRNALTTIAATATDVSGIARVEFTVNGVLTCTDVSGPFSCAWNVPNKPNVTYVLQAKAYDNAGNMAAGSTVTVTSK